MIAAPGPDGGGDGGGAVGTAAPPVLDGPDRARAARRLAGAPTDPALQRLAQLAARLLSAPASQVSLLTDVQTISALAGQDPALLGTTTPLAESLCAVTAAGGAPLVVEDAVHDARVASMPSVTGGAVGAYLGVPLLGQDGHVVGALCVFDPLPRRWAPVDVAVLSDLAQAAVAELELSALSLEYEADRLRWQLAVAAGGVGSFDWDLRADVLNWDPRVLELFGYTADDFDGTMGAFEARVHPDDLERVRRLLEVTVRTGAPFEAEYRLVLPDGDTRWVKARGETLRGGDGRATHLLGAVYDTTAERREDARVSRVLESMSSAFFSLDRDWCFSYVNAEAERVLQRPREEMLGRNVWELFPDAVGAEFEEQYRRAMDTGEQVNFEAYYPAPMDRWYEVRAWRDPDGLSVYFLDVTERRSAQQRAERTAERLALLARVSADLSATLDTEEAVARLALHLVPALGDWCLVTLVEGGGTLRDIGCWHVEEALRPLLQRYREVRLSCLSSTAPLHRALREDRPVVIAADATERLGGMLSEPARGLLRRLAPESAQMVPLRARGRTVGLVTVFRGAGAPALTEEDLLTATEVADRAGLALDNARLYAQQQHMAEGLQRALLSAPVEPDHLQVAVRYRPARQAAQVGGDWYDAFMQPDGATVLVIGDVMGHDIDAAAAMSQVRSLLRGIAYFSGEAPAAVLSGLDAAMEGLTVDTTATAVVARLEQSLDERRRGVTRLRWSNAGHPPPMLLTPDGTVTVLSGLGHDLLLGIDPRAPRVDEEVALDRGSTLLMYTDGLVERRGQDYDDGLVRLRDAITELAGESLEDLCDGILERLLPEHAEDDVALVAVRLHPQDRPRPAEAGPHRVPPHVPDEPRVPGP